MHGQSNCKRSTVSERQPSICEMASKAKINNKGKFIMQLDPR